jgi:hypothetical protein
VSRARQTVASWHKPWHNGVMDVVLYVLAYLFLIVFPVGGMFVASELRSIEENRPYNGRGRS